MKLNTLVIAFSVLGLMSCDSEQKPKETEEKKELKFAEETCTYTYDPTNVKAAWTAFKFTEKAGVGGQFDSVTVKTSGTVDSPEKILGGLSFEIPINSVNTNNPDRDKKIRESFFGTLANTDVISGTVMSMKGNNDSGTAMVSLSMNDSTYQQELNYNIEGSQVSLTGTIDVGNWNGNDAISALNKVCEELHKGENGESVLWPTVDIAVSAVLSRDCN